MMGLFGKKKTAPSGNNDYSSKAGNVAVPSSDYHQMDEDSIPIAMAVAAAEPSAEPSAPSELYDYDYESPTLIPTATVTGAPMSPSERQVAQQQQQQQQPQAPSSISITQQPQATASSSSYQHAPTCSSAQPPVFISRRPMKMRFCPHCRRTELKTYTKTKPTWKTWLISGVLFVVFWPICWIPLVVDSLKQTDHYCPACHAPVASVDAGQDCCVTTSSGRR